MMRTILVSLLGLGVGMAVSTGVAQVGAPRIIGSGSLTIAVTDPDGNRLEISQLPAAAPARLAMEGWK
jgi:hypothetical protein